MSKLAITHSFTSRSTHKALAGQAVATSVKLGRKVYDLDKTSTADFVADLTKAKKLECQAEDLRQVARYFLHRTIRNEGKRLKCEKSGYEAWFKSKNPTKSFDAHKAIFTRRANMAREAYAEICALGIAKFA